MLIRFTNINTEVVRIHFNDSILYNKVLRR